MGANKMECISDYERDVLMGKIKTAVIKVDNFISPGDKSRLVTKLVNAPTEKTGAVYFTCNVDDISRLPKIAGGRIADLIVSAEEYLDRPITRSDLACSEVEIANLLEKLAISNGKIDKSVNLNGTFINDFYKFSRSLISNIPGANDQSMGWICEDVEEHVLEKPGHYCLIDLSDGDNVLYVGGALAKIVQITGAKKEDLLRRIDSHYSPVYGAIQVLASSSLRFDAPATKVHLLDFGRSLVEVRHGLRARFERDGSYSI